jgi:hypothetical protein
MKFTKNNRLYFGCDGDTALYCVRKNKSGRWVVNKEHLIANGTTITTLNGFFFVNDYLFTMYDTAGGSGFIYRTDNTNTYTNTSTIETLINPLMAEGDRTAFKKLKAFSVAKDSTTGQLVLKYSVDGSAYVTLGTLASGGRLLVKGINESSGKPLVPGYEYQFKIESTGGAELTEVKYSYEIMPELI